MVCFLTVTIAPPQLRRHQHTVGCDGILLHLKRFVSSARQSETCSDPRASLADSRHFKVEGLRRDDVRRCHAEDEGDREGSFLGGDSPIVSTATCHLAFEPNRYRNRSSSSESTDISIKLWEKHLLRGKKVVGNASVDLSTLLGSNNGRSTSFNVTSETV